MNIAMKSMRTDEMGGKSHYNPFAESWRKKLKANKQRYEQSKRTRPDNRGISQGRDE
jgi:hypothetical protein